MPESWVIDETEPIDAKAERQIRRELPTGPSEAMRGRGKVPLLAVQLHDVVIHDTKKWFGGADIRLDALVTQGYGTKDDPKSFYKPETIRFPEVRQGEKLP